MTTKKIWLSALLFGFITAILLYVAVFQHPKSQSTTAVPSSTKAQTAAHSASTKTNQSSAQAPKTTGAGTTTGSTTKNQPDPTKLPNSLLPIEKGKRAMTIQVSLTQSVGLFLKAGSYVDVAYQNNPPAGNKTDTSATQILLQNIKVLGVGTGVDTEASAKNFKVVTLEVTPKQALTLNFATEGTFFLLLRQDQDHSTVPNATHVHSAELNKGVYGPHGN